MDGNYVLVDVRGLNKPDNSVVNELYAYPESSSTFFLEQGIITKGELVLPWGSELELIADEKDHGRYEKGISVYPVGSFFKMQNALKSEEFTERVLPDNTTIDDIKKDIEQRYRISIPHEGLFERLPVNIRFFGKVDVFGNFEGLYAKIDNEPVDSVIQDMNSKYHGSVNRAYLDHMNMVEEQLNGNPCGFANGLPIGLFQQTERPVYNSLEKKEMVKPAIIFPLKSKFHNWIMDE